MSTARKLSPGSTAPRFLLKELVKRDFQSRYAGSLLGVMWPLVQPLFQLLLFTWVFGSVLSLSPIGERTDSFASFLFAGLLPWMAFQEGLSRSATAITDNANLVKNLRFPSEILVLAAVIGGLIQAGIAGLVFLVVLAITGNLALGGLPLLLPALLLQVAFTLGLGLLLCAVHTVFRDTAQMLNLVMLAWFYLTPIVYPLSLVPEEYVGLVQLNPLTGLATLYREAFFSGVLSWTPGLVPLGVASALALLVGWVVFRRLKSGLVDDL